MMELFLYREAETGLHRLDARTKILGMVACFVVALLFSHPLLLLGQAGLILGLAVLGRCVANLRKMGVLLALLFFYCLILWPLFLKGPLEQTVLFGLGMGVRLDVMVIVGVIVLSTTRIEDFTAGLHRLGLPAPAAFACSLAFRWVPAFLGTAHAIVQAQRARGLDLQGGHIVARIGRYVPLVIPLMAHAIRQTRLLAMALEAKGFDPGVTRPHAESGRLAAADRVVLAGTALLLAACLWLRWKGYGIVEGVGF